MDKSALQEFLESRMNRPDAFVNISREDEDLWVVDFYEDDSRTTFAMTRYFEHRGAGFVIKCHIPEYAAEYDIDETKCEMDDIMAGIKEFLDDYVRGGINGTK